MELELLMTPESLEKGSSCSHYAFEKGIKGKLTTKHNNPRKLKSKDVDEKFKVLSKALGGSEKAKQTIDNFTEINLTSPEMADGILHNVINGHETITVRIIKDLFGVGSSRYYRVKRGQIKQVPGGLNGLQVSKLILNYSDMTK